MNDLEFKRLAIAKRNYNYLLFYPDKSECNVDEFTPRIIIDNSNRLVCLITSNIEYFDTNIEILKSNSIAYKTEEVSKATLDINLKKILDNINLESIGNYYAKEGNANISLGNVKDGFKLWADINKSDLTANINAGTGSDLTLENLYEKVLFNICFNEDLPLIILPKEIDLKSTVSDITYETVLSTKLSFKEELITEYKCLISEVLKSNTLSIIAPSIVKDDVHIILVRIAKLKDYDNSRINLLDGESLEVLNYIERN